MEEVGLFWFLAGTISLLSSLLIIYWIKRQEWYAQQGDNQAVKSVIFPVFVSVLWFNAAVNLYFAAVELYAAGPDDNQNYPLQYKIMISLGYAGQHMVVEGVAFLLMQKGLGSFAAYRASQQACLWGLVVFSCNIIILTSPGKNEMSGDPLVVALDFLYQSVQFIFYFVLWKCPKKYLFRRPALLKYAQFWALYRLFVIINDGLRYNVATNTTSLCLGALFRDMLLSLIQPYVSYWTLLQDSR